MAVSHNLGHSGLEWRDPWTPWDKSWVEGCFCPPRDHLFPAWMQTWGSWESSQARPSGCCLGYLAGVGGGGTC